MRGQLQPFHGGNTASNPVGDAISSLCPCVQFASGVDIQRKIRGFRGTREGFDRGLVCPYAMTVDDFHVEKTDICLMVSMSQTDTLLNSFMF